MNGLAGKEKQNFLDVGRVQSFEYQLVRVCCGPFLKQAEEVEQLQVLPAVRLVLVNSVGPMLLMQMAYAGGGS